MDAWKSDAILIEATPAAAKPTAPAASVTPPRSDIICLRPCPWDLASSIFSPALVRLPENGMPQLPTYCRPT